MAVRAETLELPRVGGIPYSLEDAFERQLREGAFRWANSEIPPFVEEARLNFYKHMATRGTGAEVPLMYPHGLMKKAAEQGLLGMVVQDTYGGLGLTPLQQVSGFEPVCQVDAGGGLNVLVQNTLAARPVEVYGTKTQKERYLPGLVEGSIIGSAGLSEPGVGSDLMNLRTQATKTRDGFLVSGRKVWITSAHVADFMNLLVRTGTVDSKGAGLTMFIAPLDHQSPHLNIRVIPKLGQHTSQFCEVTFTNYFLPDDSVLGEVDGGGSVVKDTFDLSRFWIAAQGTAIAMHAYELAVAHANMRDMFDTKEVDMPLMMRNLDHAKREIDIARLLVRKAAWEKQKENPHAYVWTAVAKAVAAEVAFLTSHNSELFHGANGYTTDYEIGYLAADAEVLRIYEGSRETLIELAKKKRITEEMLALVWPRADHPIKPIESLPSALDVIAEVERWEIDI